ncbi:NUDIX domain protein [Caprobacter fermentans]|uniref:NUDIX domain protein n=1 Tax=Caproicibacter fermentans TaxID=2576756 RepID=A0A6N8HWI3_9FIRM|nr:NUDIX domain-containing protein [Caproicibacter fermentans]MVB10181.1 NUDIX domain protein [Caproicibacter fermentans]OCN00827.1 ADP-ribose pyrophosphatase [Clostridium sp. W14A]QNK41771.1 NUDIX hydrolase [Caproicibacter fermentans]
MADSRLRNEDGLTEQEFLRQYDVTRYQRPSVSVDLLLFTVVNGPKFNYRKLPEKEVKVLMVKRGNHPFIGQWALPGGFMSVNESLDDAAYRELKEEVNVSDIYMEQLYTWGNVDRDPRTRVISCSYMSLVDSSQLQIKAGGGAWDARWFTLGYEMQEEKKEVCSGGYLFENLVKLTLSGNDETLSAVIGTQKRIVGRCKTLQCRTVENSGIAFDHAMVIQYGLERLRNKIEYTDIAFNLMPRYFTLTELQQVYEVILGKELLKANFRRKIADMVIETNRVTKDAGHRPSKLYMFNSNRRESNF